MSSAPSTAPIRVLLATADPMLRETRKALIQSFGFDVTASKTEDDALSHMRTERFDLLVLGHTLPARECRNLANAFRVYHPNGRIIEIIRTHGMSPVNNPDAIVVGMDGQIALRDTLEAQSRIARGAPSDAS
jgi:CheY-like chemotaxis protein